MADLLSVVVAINDVITQSHRTVRADSQHALWGFYSQVSDHFLTIQILFLLYLLLRLKNPLHELIIYIVSF